MNQQNNGAIKEASADSKTFAQYAQQLSQMEIRKRKLHHQILRSRALKNPKNYPPTGQSPRLDLGDKPAVYAEPQEEPWLRDLHSIGDRPPRRGTALPTESGRSSRARSTPIIDEETGYTNKEIAKMADLIRQNFKIKEALSAAQRSRGTLSTQHLS